MSMAVPSAPRRKRLVERLCVCPACHRRLEWGEDAVICNSCAASYPLLDGIPLLVTGGVGGGGHVDSADGHKLRQAEFFDKEDDEFEITRPHGEPALYGSLLEQKLELGVAGVGPLAGSSVVCVCGGSGLDGEFLARRGAEVIVCDISPGAARRARERARRYGLDMTAIVADAEALPFAAHSIDIAYVHDGLHHLERPLVGLTEMARVAAYAVSVNEPARASATALAVRLGIAEANEEAGNPVARLELDALAARLEAQGMRVTVASRYAMYYAHRPGAPSRLFSRPATLPLARRALDAFNRVAGSIGNKLTVQAVRER
jgi:ubiquinone/menaquinone biosynthesis C-methylase UbiE